MTLTLALVAGAGMNTIEHTSATISLYDLTRTWGEGTTESDAIGVQTTGHGEPANPGDATWNAASFPSGLWTHPGGDHSFDSASVTATLTLVNNATMGTAYTWPSTPQTVADVQGWLNNPTTNFGWELINADEVDPKTLFGFYSREWHKFTGGMASQEPVLQVTYTPATTVPVSPWATWVACAGVMMVSFRALRGGREVSPRTLAE